MTTLDGSTLIVAGRDGEDGEQIRDIDTEQGKTNHACSHYMDVMMMASDMTGITVNVETILGVNRLEEDREREEREEVYDDHDHQHQHDHQRQHNHQQEYYHEQEQGDHEHHPQELAEGEREKEKERGEEEKETIKSTVPSTEPQLSSLPPPSSSSPTQSPERLQPRLADHSYVCRFTDEYDRLEYDHTSNHIPTENDFSTVSVTPKLVYIIPPVRGRMNEEVDEWMMKNEVLIFNHTCNNLPFSVSSSR